MIYKTSFLFIGILFFYTFLSYTIHADPIVSLYQKPSSLKGEWNGALIVQSEVIRSTFHIFEENGVWKATLDLPDNGVFDIPFQISSKKDSVVLTRADATSGIHTTYSFSVSKRVWAGSYSFQQSDRKVEGVFQAVLSPVSLSKFQPLPPFELALLDKKVVRNSSYKGKYLLIDFWMTTCKICIPKRPELETVYRLYKDKPFEILSIALDSEADVAAFRKEKSPMAWDNAVLKGKWEHDLVKQFDIDKLGLPTTLLISPDGKVLAKTEALTKENLLKTVSKFLKNEPAKL